MKETKVKKHTSILKLMRNILQIPLHKITYVDGRKILGIHYMEEGEVRPKESTILSISTSLKINPEILLYSFGYLPDKEQKIISSDPFYYREKILNLCNNHEYRYESNVDLDLLNIKRVADYIENNRVEVKKKKKREPDNESDK